MAPEVSLVPFAGYAQVGEGKRVGAGAVVAVEQAHNVIAVRHLAEPYLVVLVVEFVGQRLTHELVGVQLQHFGVGVELQVVADGVVLVGHGYGTAGHELQRNHGLALGVGMLVDISIVVIENIFRYRRDGMSAKDAAIHGAKEVSAAIISSTLTTVIVFVPIVFTQGITRQLFTDMALTIAYSLLASLAVALTVVPAACSTMLRKPVTQKRNFIDKMADGYGKLLKKSLKHSWVTIVLCVALLATSVVAAFSSGTELFPEMDTGSITVSVSMPDSYNENGEKFGKIWEQIAERFKDYDQKLMFEAINEILDPNNNWGGGKSGDPVEGLKNYNQKFVDTVRKGGGYNATRNLIIMTYAGGYEALEIPTDPAKDHMLLEVHDYDPQGFCWKNATWTTMTDEWGSDEDKKAIDSSMDRIAADAKEKGLPVIIGEWGSQDKKGNEDARAVHAGYFAKAAWDRGIKCFWWDCGDFAIIDRDLCQKKCPKIVDAIIENSK